MDNARVPPAPRIGLILAGAVLVSVAYYVGANIGFILRIPSSVPSVLWPPNTILTAALLLTEPRRWWIYLLAALPAHLLAELPLEWPTALVLILFLTNCSEALMAAAGVRWFSDVPGRFDTFRRVVAFILAAGLVAPFLSSFVDAMAVSAVQHEPYWLVWRTRCFSNILTELILGPAMVMAVTAAPAWIRRASPIRQAEAWAITLALLIVGSVAFGVIGPDMASGPVAPIITLLPFVLLLTVRFGPGGASLALLGTSLIAIWAAVHGEGPFGGRPADTRILEMQILLIVLAIPIQCLAAVIVERRQATRALEGRLRLEALLARLSAAFVHLPSHEMDPVFETWLRQLGQVLWVDRVMLGRRSGGSDEMVVSYAWHTSGSSGEFPPVLNEDFPWMTQQLIRERVVAFSRPADLPEEAARDADSLRRYGVRSGLIIPLVSGSRVLGSLSLLTLAAERTWRDEPVPWLHLVAEVLANALGRKEAEDAVRASELMKSAILGSLSAQVAVIDRDGRIIDVNASWRRLANELGPGTPAGVGVGDNYLDTWWKATATPQWKDAGAGIEAVLDRCLPGFALEYHVRQAATERWFAMSVVPLDRPEGGAVVSCTEVTERKRAELDAQRSRQELAHFTRVSTMGELTASLAHELNQPLTGILTNARAGLRFLGAVPPQLGELHAILSDIADDDKRAGEVIQRLRDLLRKGEPQQTLLDLNVLVEDVVKLLGSDAIIRNVTVMVDLAPVPVVVMGDRVQLQQVVLNLLLNAMEAMVEDTGGNRMIVVRTENISPEAVNVSVQDAGIGLRADTDDLLFEPFYTSKPGGMGMGLAIARSIIEAHGGLIWAMNNPEGGATFRFALPRTGQSAS